MKFSTKKLLLLTLLYIGGGLFLALTDPKRLPLTLLILPFIYAFITIFLTIRFFISLVTQKERFAKLVALTVSIFIVLILVLASINQLSSKDILISATLAILLSWYFSKLQSN